MSILSIALLLFIVLDPFGNMVTLNTLLSTHTPARRRRIMLRESLIALGILLLCVVGGGTLLSALGLDAYTLGISGGIVLEGSGWLQPRPRTAFMLVMIWCCVLAAFAMTTIYPLALALLFAAGFVELSYNSMTQALVQLNAPAAIRGRVLGLYSMAGLGLRAFSGITVGLGGSLIGIHWSLALSAMLLLAITLLLQLWMRSAVFDPGT
jgi:MFS family permease